MAPLDDPSHGKGNRFSTKELFTASSKILLGRWFMVFASLLIMVTSGATFLFGTYSKDLKSSLGYTQQKLNTVSLFKDMGSNIGIVAGLLSEVAPPWLVLIIGAVFNFFGYFMVWLSITDKISRPALWQMCLYICIGANSNSFSNTGALVTCIKSFPGSRGIIIGLLKGYVGLSGAVFTQLYLAIYGDDSKSLVLLIAWLPAVISVIFVYAIRPIDPVKLKTDEKENQRPFFYLLYASLALAGYLMVIIVVEKVGPAFSHPAYSVNAAVVVVLVFLPLAVVVKEELRIYNRMKKVHESPRAMSIIVDKKSEKEPKPELNSEAKPNSFLSRFCRTFKSPERGEDFTIPQALVSVDMIALFIVTICGIGGTETAVDNLGQIGQSLGYPARTINTFVSLVSIWNYAGRVTAGFLSEILLLKFKFPRPLMLTAVLLISCVGHLLIAFGVPNSLYVSSIILGFCLGAQFPLLFAIISEIFGLKYYSTLYNFGALATPIGLYVLNVKITGQWYDREAARQNNGVKEATCMGVVCFKKSFLIIVGVTLFGALVSLILVWRSWSFYRGDIYRRFKTGGVEDEDKVENEVAMVKVNEKHQVQ